MDYLALGLEGIEKELNINHISKYPYNTNKLDYSILDDWESVSDFINSLAQSHNSTAVYGYELVHDNHYIKVYYRNTYTNS